MKEAQEQILRHVKEERAQDLAQTIQKIDRENHEEIEKKVDRHHHDRAPAVCEIACFGCHDDDLPDRRR